MTRRDMHERLESRRWLVDELRIISPPQHFMTRSEVVDQRRCIDLLLEQRPNNALHLYVHVPFCEERCTFCMYFDRGAKQGSDRVQAYSADLARLVRHFEHRLGDRQIQALYVGGGTASILTEQQIDEVFGQVMTHLDEEAEATFEMSPRSSSPEKLAKLRSLGFNRVSFGLQSFSEPLLRAMRRAPTSRERMGELLDCAVGLGFDDVNVDLMVGLELEQPDDLLRSAEALFELRPPSVSVYRESRPRTDRADLQSGVEAFLRDVVAPRVAATARLAESLDYQVPTDLSSEHVRFKDRRLRWRNMLLRCRYRTRYDPRVETTLIGLGPNAFSFCGASLYAVNQTLQDRERTRRDLSRIYFASTEERGAAIAVNLLYLAPRCIERPLFHEAAGADVDDLFAAELSFLEERELVRSSERAVHRICQDASTWAYSDKLLYPERWIRRTRRHGF